MYVVSLGPSNWWPTVRMQGGGLGQLLSLHFLYIDTVMIILICLCTMIWLTIRFKIYSHRHSFRQKFEGILNLQI